MEDSQEEAALGHTQDLGEGGDQKGWARSTEVSEETAVIIQVRISGDLG